MEKKGEDINILPIELNPDGSPKRPKATKEILNLCPQLPPSDGVVKLTFPDGKEIELPILHRKNPEVIL